MVNGNIEDIFLTNLETAEKTYFDLLNKGLTPQQAREVLPLSLKTEIVMTGFEYQWKDFFKLRCANSAHPDIRKLADRLNELMKSE